MLEHLTLSTLNHLLAGSDWARDRLRPFAGRHLHVSLLPVQMTLLVDPEGYFATSARTETDVDVRITLPPAAGARMFGGVEALMQEAHIEGNAEFAQEIGFVLRNLRWDYEEDLSRLVGDIAARRLTTSVGGFLRWQRDAMQRFTENAVEYLTEEQAVLAKQGDLQKMARDVRALETALDALERADLQR